MSDIVKGMGQAYLTHLVKPGTLHDEAMRAALMWLADNVTEKMARAAYVKTRETDHLNNMHQCIAAAIHAAAGGEG